MKRQPLIRGKGILFASLIVISSLAVISTGQAAPVSINYSLTGGAAFHTFSGSATATLNYSIYGGSTYSASLTGNASGAISWNLSGSMTAWIDDSLGTISTTQSLYASRRAGVVNVDFPVINLGGLLDYSVGGTIKSAASSIQKTNESGQLLNNTDWIVLQEHTLPTGVDTTLAGIPTPLHTMPFFPEVLTLVNNAGGSAASLGITGTAPTMSAGFLNQAITPGCVLPGILVDCIVGISSIDFDFTNVTVTSSFIAATGTSPTSLPAVVPIPASVWLFGSGIIGLFGFSGYRRRNN